MMKTYAIASALALTVSAGALAQGAPDFRVDALQTNAYEIQAGQIALAKSRNPQIRAYANEAIRDHRAASDALAGGAPDGPQAAQRGGPIGGLVEAPLAVAGGAVGAAAGVVGGTLSGGPVGGLEGAGSGAARGAAAGSGLGRRDVLDTGATVLAPNPAQQAMLADLSATPAGPSFDRLYVSQQIQSHQMAIGMAQSYASGGPNPALRTHAQQALPVYEQHYREARQLQRGL